MNISELRKLAGLTESASPVVTKQGEHKYSIEFQGETYNAGNSIRLVSMLLDMGVNGINDVSLKGFDDSDAKALSQRISAAYDHSDTPKHQGPITMADWDQIVDRKNELMDEEGLEDFEAQEQAAEELGYDWDEVSAFLDREFGEDDGSHIVPESANDSPVVAKRGEHVYQISFQNRKFTAKNAVRLVSMLLDMGVNSINDVSLKGFDKSDARALAQRINAAYGKGERPEHQGPITMADWDQIVDRKNELMDEDGIEDFEAQEQAARELGYDWDDVSAFLDREFGEDDGSHKVPESADDLATLRKLAGL